MLYDRPKRMRGNPGIHATQYKAGWTIYGPPPIGIIIEGLNTEECKELLATLEVKVKRDEYKNVSES